MQIDVRSDARNGWIVFAAALAIAATSLFLSWDGGALAQQVEAERAKLPTGGKPIADLVRRQREANRSLQETIDQLKRQVGFSIEDAFEVGNEEMYRRQPGYYFVTKRDSIVARLNARAKEKGIGDYDQYAGFGLGLKKPPADSPPEDRYADDLLKMLQLTDKVVSICLETPTPLQRLYVLPRSGAIKPEVVSPPGRPPLLREYRLSLDVRGSLTDILWILHRLSPGRTAPAEDYPLVLKSLRITSLNTSPIQSIPQLDVSMVIAGMEFLGEADRDRAPTAGPGARRPAAERSAPPAAAPAAVPSAESSPGAARSF
jgi:hypothetical protein